jgi:hypothetical protein
MSRDIGEDESTISESNDDTVVGKFRFHGLISPDIPGKYECIASNVFGNTSAIFYVSEFFPQFFLLES